MRADRQCRFWWLLSITAACLVTVPAASQVRGESLNTSATTATMTAGTPAPAAATTSTAGAPTTPSANSVVYPLVILAVGVLIVLGLIIGLKVNAFIALISAAIVVSLMAPGPWTDRIARVAVAFGESAGKIGIVIAMAAIIGKCMLDSGAADRIVRAFLRLFGERRAPIALMGSGFVLAIPVFFDTVFYLLVPLARSLHRRTGRHYLLYVLAIAAGGAITHTLVPPTPGPLVMADQLNFSIGVMMVVGAAVALPSALAGLIFSTLADRWMPVPMRSIGATPEPKPLADAELPGLAVSLAPVLLPVVLISANTLFGVVSKAMPLPAADQAAIAVAEDAAPGSAASADTATTKATTALLLALVKAVRDALAIVGNANFALMLSAVIAMLTLAVQRGLTRPQLATVVEQALMSGGVIILITAGGGAFGAMLKQAAVGDALKTLFAGAHATGLMILLLGFGIAAVLKIAQGSSTVAMITGSAMLAGIASADTLGFHPVYLATAIGSGSLFGSWMNDSGFWIFAKMSGLTEVEALKSWTTMLLVLALTGLGMTMLLAFAVSDPTFSLLG